MKTDWKSERSLVGFYDHTQRDTGWIYMDDKYILNVTTSKTFDVFQRGQFSRPLVMNFIGSMAKTEIYFSAFRSLQISP